MLRRELLEPSTETLDYLSKRYPPEKAWPANLLECILPVWDLLKRYDGTVDYEDFCWLGHYYENIYYPRYSVLIVDECQDLSPLYYSFIRKVSQHQILVGDPNQAINGWNGGDIHMFEKQSKSSAVFHMKDCFRCPPNIIDRANQVATGEFPLIPVKTDPIPTKPVFPLVDKLDNLSPRDTIILSRYNAQLVQACIHLRMKGVAAHLEGNKDIAGPVVKFAKMASRGMFSSRLPTICQDWCADSDLPKRVLNTYQDYTDCIKHVWPVESFDELTDSLKNLFKKQHSSFPLMSIHQSKGQEAEHVFCVGPLAGFDDSEYSQEPNCEYVGLTRTQAYLYQ
jgi:hypothetical protein